MSGFVVLISIVNFCMGQSFDITTNLTYGMQTYGHMFDIVSTQQPINIQNIGLHFSLNNIRSNVQIYSKKGSWIGYDNNITEWRLIHQTSVITSSNVLTNLGILQTNVIIPAKETQAFYITVTGSSLEYGNTSYITGNVYKSDNNIQLLTGISKRNLNGSITYNVSWNGYIYYEYECDAFKMIDGPGSYSLRAYQDETVVPGEKICYQIDKGYSCKDPYISIIAKGIDIDQYSGFDEYIDIKYKKDGITQKVYDHCEDSTPCSCCLMNITCVNEYVGDNTFESGIIYGWTLTNGVDVDALCAGPETMDAQIILTCNGTRTPTLSPTISTSNPSTITLAPTTNPTITPTISPTMNPTTTPSILPTASPSLITGTPTISVSHCNEIIEINKEGSYKLNGYATEMNAERTLCWIVSSDYTCYYPELTVVTKEIDYDQANEWLRAIFRVNGDTVNNYGQCKGSLLDRCDRPINCVNDKINDPLMHNNLYEVRLTIGSQVNAYCSPKRTIDADVTITCSDSNSPTINPSFPSMFPTTFPTESPTMFPSIEPTIMTHNPTLNTITPSQIPTQEPTLFPSNKPTIETLSPSIEPTFDILLTSTKSPSKNPASLSTTVTLDEILDSGRNQLLSNTKSLVIVISAGSIIFCVIICLTIIFAFKMGANKTKRLKNSSEGVTTSDNNNSSTLTCTPNNIEITPMSINKQIKPKRLQSISEDELNGYLSTPGSDGGPINTSKQVIQMQQQMLNTITKTDITTNILPTPGMTTNNSEDLYNDIQSNALPNENSNDIIDDITHTKGNISSDNINSLNDGNITSLNDDIDDILYQNTQTNGEIKTITIE